jgi:hypothetical protein
VEGHDAEIGGWAKVGPDTPPSTTLHGCLQMGCQGREGARADWPKRKRPRQLFAGGLLHSKMLRADSGEGKNDPTRYLSG